MPGICCAVGCDNSRQRNPGLQFVSIPKDVDRRNKWLAAIRRDHWQPTSNSRLCSQHFVSGRKNDNPMSPDYIPSLFAHTSAGQRQRSIYATSRFEHTQQMKRKRTETLVPDSDHETVAPPSTSDATGLDITLVEQVECVKDDHSYSQAILSSGIVEPCSNAACQATVKALTNECARLRAEVNCLKDKVNVLSFNEEAFKGNDEMVQELTGLPSYAKMMVVFGFLSGFVKAGPRLTPFHSFLLTLMRMRLNLPLYFFVYLFHMSKSSVVRMFNNTLDVMYVRLSPLIFWPSKDQIQVSLPMCFRDNFSNCTSIIDCFEMFVEKPKN
ncbi:uncharacterized protein LOC117475554 [Trematomus bernacchii]|uniref:uncharacterized protein LOC117475554 n=1 Tax=Trematomus bernacchii TaxID=40690 RepID=UPI00146A95C0|nr:uncharacterized protein LOC117475554 [Trematomus bernacchii]